LRKLLKIGDLPMADNPSHEKPWVSDQISGSSHSIPQHLQEALKISRTKAIEEIIDGNGDVENALRA
jgi:hypothetical protein